MNDDQSGRNLRISGYASLFDMRDLSGDIVRRGAFSASLLLRAGAALPMLLGHDTQSPIGVWDRLVEDRTGLFVSGLVMGGEKRADRAQRFIKAGGLSGLSIGYQTQRSRPKASGRELLELNLWEVSVVAFPMLPHARITQIGGQAEASRLASPTHIQYNL